MNKPLTVCILLLMLISCTRWPKPSTGGYAANYLYSPAYQKAISRAPDLTFLSMELLRVKAKMRPMYNSNIAACMPARVRLITQLDNQITQEITGGLLFAANMDLKLLESNVDELIKIQRPKGCPNPRHVPRRSWDQLQMRLE